MKGKLSSPTRLTIGRIFYGLCLLQPLHAADFEWQFANGGDYDINLGWNVISGSDADNVPDADDNVFFNNAFGGDPYTIDFPSGTTTARRLVVDPTASSGRVLDITFDLRGNTFEIVPQVSPSIVFGGADADSVAVDIVGMGELIGEDAVIGEGVGATSSSVVVRDGSTWTNNGSLIAGKGHLGALEVAGGARVESHSSIFGDGAEGRLDIRNPGSVFADTGDMIVGQSSTGNVLVREGGSLEIDGSLQLGTQALGTLEVRGFESSVEVDMIDGAISVGGAGRGRIDIDDGGEVFAEFIRIGTDSLGSGVVNVNDGNLTARRDLEIAGVAGFGPTGPGTLNIGPDGRVDSATLGGVLRLFPDAEVNMNNGLLEVGEILADPGARFRFNAGEVRLYRDTVLDAEKRDLLLGGGEFGGIPAIGPGQHLNFDGELIPTARLELNGGELSVGSLANRGLIDFQSGTLRFTGDDPLRIDPDGPLGSDLHLEDGQRLEQSGSAQVDIADAGRVIIADGAHLRADDIINNGEILLGGRDARISGMGGIFPEVQNSGFIEGSGRIEIQLNNQAGGRVRVGADSRLVLAGDESSSNAGTVSVESGRLDVQGGLVNEADGEIFLADLARFETANATMSSGLISIANSADLFGELVNQADGEIRNADDGTARFFGDVTQDGTLRTLAGSESIFLGDVSGSGSFLGAGDAIFSGTFSPGSSPGIVTFGGDFKTTAGSNLLIEIGGLLPGEEFDVIDVAGDAVLEGMLTIDLLDDFLPNAGDSFDILQVGGELNADNLTLAGDFPFRFGVDGSGLSLTAIPEPRSMALLAGLAVVLVTALRRRSRK